MTGMLGTRLGGVPVVVRRWTVPGIGRSILLAEPVLGSVADRTTFMGFDEYVRYREEIDVGHDTQVHHVFERLMQRPGEESVDLGGSRVGAALSALRANQPGGISSNWFGMEPYWRWAAMMYGPEIVDRFGGLDIVDAGLLPMGMVSYFRDKKVTWQG